MGLLEPGIPILVRSTRDVIRRYPSLSQILSDPVRTITPVTSTPGKNLGEAAIALLVPFGKIRDHSFDQARGVVGVPELMPQLFTGMFTNSEIAQTGRLDGRAFRILRLAQISSPSVTGDTPDFMPAVMPANAFSRILASRVLAISGCSFRKFFTLSLP